VFFGWVWLLGVVVCGGGGCLFVFLFVFLIVVLVVVVFFFCFFLVVFLLIFVMCGGFFWFFLSVVGSVCLLFFWLVLEKVDAVVFSRVWARGGVGWLCGGVREGSVWLPGGWLEVVCHGRRVCWNASYVSLVVGFCYFLVGVCVFVGGEGGRGRGGGGGGGGRKDLTTRGGLGVFWWLKKGVGVVVRMCECEWRV